MTKAVAEAKLARRVARDPAHKITSSLPVFLPLCRECHSLMTPDEILFTSPLVSSDGHVVRDNRSFIPSEETAVIREKTIDPGAVTLRSKK